MRSRSTLPSVRAVGAQTASRLRRVAGAAALSATVSAVVFGAAGCSSSAATPDAVQTHNPVTIHAVASPPPGATTATTASPTPTVVSVNRYSQNFVNGLVYYAWITNVGTSPAGPLTLELAHHQTSPVSDADLGVSSIVNVGPAAHVLARPAGVPATAAPVPMTVAAFLTWLQGNLAKPVGGHASGPIFEIGFTGDVVSSITEE